MTNCEPSNIELQTPKGKVAAVWRYFRYRSDITLANAVCFVVTDWSDVMINDMQTNVTSESIADDGLVVPFNKNFDGIVDIYGHVMTVFLILCMF